MKRKYGIEVREERMEGGSRPTVRWYPYLENGEAWGGSLEDAQAKCRDLNRWSNTGTLAGYPAQSMKSYRPKREEE